jgi:hypothetical protein
MKPGVAFWATVGLVGLVLYALSWPPASYVYSRCPTAPWVEDAFAFVYWPCGWLYSESPAPARKLYRAYAETWPD